jgi:hypothetical protein
MNATAPKLATRHSHLAAAGVERSNKAGASSGWLEDMQGGAVENLDINELQPHWGRAH